jgi:hypothetical protein
MLDIQTNYAISILRRHVMSSPDRKARRALEHLMRQIDAASANTTSTNTGLLTSALVAEDDDKDDELPSVEPSPREMGTFVRACMAARAHGLTLRPDTRFRWFDLTEGGELIGFALMLGDEDPATIFLARGLSDFDLFRTVLHELKHVADNHTLGAAEYRALQKDERERRAREFEARVMSVEGRWIV